MHTLKISPQRYLLIFKRRILNLQEKKATDHFRHMNEVCLASPVIKHVDIMYLLICDAEKGVTLSGILAKAIKFIIIIRKKTD